MVYSEDEVFPVKKPRWRPGLQDSTVSIDFGDWKGL
jgi:hypothetical protein